MKLEDIIRMPIQDEEDLLRLKKAVTKTKWFSRFDANDLTTDVLETGYRKVIQKYPARISYIMNASENAWSFMIRENGTHVTTIICKTLYEGLCKTIIALYGYNVLGKKF